MQCRPTIGCCLTPDPSFQNRHGASHTKNRGESLKIQDSRLNTIPSHRAPEPPATTTFHSIEARTVSSHTPLTPLSYPDSTDKMPSQNGFLHLARPIGPSMAGTQPSTTPLSVIIKPSALFSILDHSTRRPVDQHRVIGTLLGTRSDSDETLVTIHSAFAVGHTETTDQVEVDMECQKSMLSLHLRANPKEILVGWYATSSELNTFSALIQNHYSSPNEGTFPFPAVHLTVSSEPGKDIDINTYISSPVGTTDERAADSAAFIPVPHTIQYSDSDRAGIDAVSGAKDLDNRSTTTILSDIENLEKSIEDTLGMLDRVGRYVDAVIEEEAEPSTALGQYLLNALALAPKVDPAEIEKDFNNHIQDVLTVSYLANTIRTQMDLSNRLATAQLTLGTGGGGSSGEGGAAGGNKEGGGGGDNKGGNRRQGGGGGQNRQNRGESISAGGL